MVAIFFAFLTSCVFFLVCGVPVFHQQIRIDPPVRRMERIKRTGVNPEELGGGFEGDIILPGYNPKSSARGTATISTKKWPYGIVPYDLSAIDDSDEREMIINAMNIIMYDTGSPINGSSSRRTCVYFHPRDETDDTFLTVKYGSGCSAHAGYRPNFQSTMTLKKSGCFYSGTIQHELLHALGFYHEQSRQDRDKFVQINFENIKADMAYNFDKMKWNSSTTKLGTKYDYNSLMHYGIDYFSTNGLPTIVPKQANVKIGQREEMSPTDIAEVRLFYGCEA